MPEEERNRERELEQTVARWRLARDIRDYAAELRRMLTASTLGEPSTAELHQEAAWACAYADKVDPLQRLR